MLKLSPIYNGCSCPECGGEIKSKKPPKFCDDPNYVPIIKMTCQNPDCNFEIKIRNHKSIAHYTGTVIVSDRKLFYCNEKQINEQAVANIINSMESITYFGSWNNTGVYLRNYLSNKLLICS